VRERVSRWSGFALGRVLQVRVDQCAKWTSLPEYPKNSAALSDSVNELWQGVPSGCISHQDYE
jgi:hypothetical protein